MERTNRCSLDTTISHSSHATECDDVCKQYGNYDVCTASIDEWEHSMSRETARPVVKRGGYETAHVVTNIPKQNQKEKTAIVIAVVVCLLSLLIIAAAELAQATRCQSPT